MPKQYKTSIAVPKELTPQFTEALEEMQEMFPLMRTNALLTHAFLYWAERMRALKEVEAMFNRFEEQEVEERLGGRKDGTS